MLTRYMCECVSPISSTVTYQGNLKYSPLECSHWVAVLANLAATNKLCSSIGRWLHFCWHLQCLNAALCFSCLAGSSQFSSENSFVYTPLSSAAYPRRAWRNWIWVKNVTESSQGTDVTLALCEEEVMMRWCVCVHWYPIDPTTLHLPSLQPGFFLSVLALQLQ